MSLLEVIDRREARYHGLRMSADNYLALPEDGHRYELVDGVIYMSPSASFDHQRISTEVVCQLGIYLRDHPVGEAVVEVDVRLRADLVYRPDIVYLSTEKAARCDTHINDVPDLIVEVVSPYSRNYDAKTKFDDYESAGVREYWLIDPLSESMSFFVLRDGRFVEAAPTGDHFHSFAIPGFTLDLARLRRRFA